ncbi:MAG TPA: hypothetical protein VFK02_23200 [Kofleriaceae bacterium]|nr:hypothetical protein [Kofleriaceae bacterium]
MQTLDRRRIAPLVVALLPLVVPACLDQPPDDESEATAELTASDPAGRAQLALRWAPVHFQDVDQTGSHALGGAADYITSYDFDGNLNGRDNWDHAGNASFPLRAVGYYSVVETSTHWFLVYLFFHPRDWTDSLFDTEHENDAEGVMFAVQRDGSTFGRLQAAVTVAHTDFFSFVPSGGTWTSGGESVDGALHLMNLADGGHPVTAQQAKGHGLKARPFYDIVGDGVVYFPSLTTGQVPSGPDDRNVLYQLVDILTPGGMWDQRATTSLFASFGSFAGDTSGGCGSGAISCSTNSANAPWGWDDHDDGPTRGALARDPAGLARAYFQIPETVSTTYTFNPFR